MQQEIRFCQTADGIRIAYARIGSGPVLVKAPNWLTHLEYEWQSPVWRHWWEELAKDHTLIRFDQRGSGLSDWTVEDISFEAWVRDLEAVVEAEGLERFALIGISQGGAVAIEYAARHPERVEKLVLFGTYARGRARRGVSLDEWEATLTLTREGWGRDNAAYRQMFTMQFMPEATLEQMNWFNELQRTSTTAANAVRIQRASSQIDVLDRLASIKAPTLVLHALRDERVAFDHGRQIASLIPGARLLALDSRNHLTLAEEPAWQTLVNEVRRFLQSPAAAPAPETPEVSDTSTRSRRSTDALTQREIDVLRLIAAGRSNQEIAEALVISINTVTNHVKSILGKTHSANRTEAASYAFRHGLVSETAPS